MVSRSAIQERVREWGLREDIVEKDYMLGWLLAAIGAHARLRDTWVFKGGTCLKKCYFETYRFSEDLDFTVIEGGPESPDELVPIFREIAAWVYEHSGVEIPAEQIRFEAYANPRGRTSVEGRVSYRGPRQVRGSLPRVKLDITADEALVRPPVRLPIAHSYPERLGGDGQVLAYSHTEIFAEKIRALAERLRPRDLYDVVTLFRHLGARPRAEEVREVLAAKCRFKGIPLPSLEGLPQAEERAELEAEWGNMLAHQLPALPPWQQFWLELPALFAWLEGAAPAEEPARIPIAVGEESHWVPPSMVTTWGLAIPLESVRFAAANRLCVELEYGGTRQIIEPHALRRTQDGNLVLHALRADSREHHAYRVDRITRVRVTSTAFTPVYAIEFGHDRT